MGEECSRSKPRLQWDIARKRHGIVTKRATQKLEHGAAPKVSLRNVFTAGRRGVIPGSSRLSKLGSIRRYFWAAQLSLSNVRVQALALSAWHYGDMAC